MIDVLVVSLTAFGIVSVPLLVVWWDKRRKQQYIAHVHAEWARQGCTIHLPPILVQYYGSEPRVSHSGIAPKLGTLGLANRQLIFTAMPHTATAHTIIFDDIHWIGTRVIRVYSGGNTAHKSALIVHYEAVDSWWGQQRRWYVAAFVSDHCYDVGYALSQQLGIKLHEMGYMREDFGPVEAQRLWQDIYGQWHPVLPDGYQGEVDWDHLKRALYLAPDRLIFHWAYSIPFTQMRRVEAYEHGARWHKINSVSCGLLRIEYMDEDSPQVAGFLVHRADQWGKAIRQRTQVPLQIHQGRKKKA